MTALDLRGRFACVLCHHDAYEHNLTVGCPHCQCLATPSEALRGDFEGPILSPGKFLHDWQKPEPTTAVVPPAFVFAPEAWWWPLQTTPREREIMIGDYTTDDGCTWEFAIVERMHRPNLRLTELLPDIPQRTGVLGLQLCVFDDAWKAFDVLPASFLTDLAALARRSGTPEPDVTLEDVRDLCLRHGFRDDTPRERVQVP